MNIIEYVLKNYDKLPKSTFNNDECVIVKCIRDENGEVDTWGINLWWERNFYPDIQMIANDLHNRGLLEAGEYLINIDW